MKMLSRYLGLKSSYSKENFAVEAEYFLAEGDKKLE